MYRKLGTQYAATSAVGIVRMLKALQELSSMSYDVCVYANGTSFALELAFLPLLNLW
jgi:hypothetical protein